MPMLGIMASGISGHLSDFTWTTKTSTSLSTYNQSLMTLGSKFIALPVASNGVGQYSTDNGGSWTNTTLPTSAAYDAGAGNTAGTLAVVRAYTAAGTASSTDGITWTSRTGNTSAWSAIVWGSNRFVAVSNNAAPNSSWSSDGITWNDVSMPVGNNWYGVAYNGTYFVAVNYAANTNGAYSTDGTSWTASTMPTGGGFQGIASNGSGFCAVAYNATAAGATSTNGTSWTARTMPQTGYDDVTWNGTNYVAVRASSTAAATSPDGITWTARTMSVSANWRNICYNGTTCMALGYYGEVSTSPSK